VFLHLPASKQESCGVLERQVLEQEMPRAVPMCVHDEKVLLRHTAAVGTVDDMVPVEVSRAFVLVAVFSIPSAVASFAHLVPP